MAKARKERCQLSSPSTMPTAADVEIFCSSFTYFAIFLQQPSPAVKINEDIVVGSVALDAQRKL